MRESIPSPIKKFSMKPTNLPNQTSYENDQSKAQILGLAVTMVFFAR